MGLPEGENLRLQCLIEGTVMAPDSEPNTEEHSHAHSLQVALREGNERKGLLERAQQPGPMAQSKFTALVGVEVGEEGLKSKAQAS